MSNQQPPLDRAGIWGLATALLLLLLVISNPFAHGWQYLGPNDLPSLVLDSNVIILGDVVRLLTNYSGMNSGGVAYYAGTVFQVDIVSYVKGLGPRTIYAVDAPFPSGDSTVNVTQRYVLFLGNNWRCAPSPPSPPCALPSTPLGVTYGIVGGPQGKFLVLDGRVYGYRSLFPEKDSFLHFDPDGIPLDSFLSQIRSVYSGEVSTSVIIPAGIAAAAIVVITLSLVLRARKKGRVHPTPLRLLQRLRL